MRASPLLGLVLTSVLAACAADRPVEMPANDSWLFQSWTVTDVALVREAPASPSPLGHQLYLGLNGTTDPGGHSCLKTVLTHGEQALSVVLGGSDQPNLLGRTVPQLTFTCNDTPFLSLARTRPDQLVGRYGPWLVWLHPSKAIIPVPYAAPVVSRIVRTRAPAEMPVEPMNTAPPADTRQIYLSSYLNVGMAMKGFEEMKAKAPSLAHAAPVFKPFEIKGKGHYIRLFAEVSHPDQACAELQAVAKESCSIEK